MFNPKPVGHSDKTVRQLRILPGGMSEIIDSSNGQNNLICQPQGKLVFEKIFYKGQGAASLWSV